MFEARERRALWEARVPRCDVAVLLAGLCLLGLLTGGCAALPGAEPTAYPPTMPSRISQAGGEATEPLPLNLTPRPSSTPEITPTPASTPVASTQHPPSDTPALAPSDTPTPTPPPIPPPPPPPGHPPAPR